jgi:hypothetical protein
MRYPTLPVDLLDDGLIECGDYSDWASACHEIKRFPDDRKILDELMVSIPEVGLLTPLMIELRNWNNRPFLSNGHHRAVALMELGTKEFTYQWRWRFPKNLPKPGPSDPLPLHVIEYLDRLKERTGS